MAAIKDYDWPKLFKDYEASNLTQRQWCADNEMNETNTAREFSALRRERAQRNIEKAQMILSGAAPLAARTVKDKLTSDDENIALKAGFGILGAVGLSPQVAAIQVNNKIDVQVLAVPIFAAEYASELDNFLHKQKDNSEKVIDADTTPDS